MIELVSIELGFSPTDIGFCKDRYCYIPDFYGVCCVREVKL